MHRWLVRVPLCTQHGTSFGSQQESALSRSVRAAPPQEGSDEIHLLHAAQECGQAALTLTAASSFSRSRVASALAACSAASLAIACCTLLLSTLLRISFSSCTSVTCVAQGGAAAGNKTDLSSRPQTKAREARRQEFKTLSTSQPQDRSRT